MIYTTFGNNYGSKYLGTIPFGDLLPGAIFMHREDTYMKMDTDTLLEKTAVNVADGTQIFVDDEMEVVPVYIDGRTYLYKSKEQMEKQCMKSKEDFPMNPPEEQSEPQPEKNSEEICEIYDPVDKIKAANPYN